MTLTARSCRAFTPLLILGGLGCADDTKTTVATPPVPATALDWTQWGKNSRHAGQVGVIGQNLSRIHATVVYDPNADAQKAETNGSLLTHYQVPLVVGDEEVLMAFQAGTYVSCAPAGSGRPAPCGSAAWNQQIWSQRMLVWRNGDLTTKWTHESDWKPVPDAGGLAQWEPVFHAVIAGDFVYVPAAGGTLDKLDRGDGSVVARINPFGAVDVNTFVVGPPAASPTGEIYYNAIRLAPGAAWANDVNGAWLVRVSAAGVASRVAYGDLVVDAPSLCTSTFTSAELPWPPSPTAKPASLPCGGQRPGVNVAPAIAPDGTVFTVSRAHLNSYDSYLVAVNANLTPKWSASLRGHLSDGCGRAGLPPTGSPGGCRAGAPDGVDPATNELPAGRVIDLSSSSPVVAPDGSILYGAYTRYNGSRGHLMKFSQTGKFQAAYDFGWDITPAIYVHDGTYSVVTKDNHYPVGSYCSSSTHCPPLQEGPYDIAQLSADLVREWRCTNLNRTSCQRNADGSMRCVEDHPNGFEWCVNAPAVDASGAVYANAEDGVLYVMDQGGFMRASLFLDSALGAAYTPLSIGRDGRIYSQNNGRLFVVGN